MVAVAVVSCVAGVAGGLWWYLQPSRREVVQMSSVAPPEQLARHCRDSIGPPRVEAVADGVFVAIGYDLANTIVVKTVAGNVVIDAGMNPARAAEVRAALAKHAPGPTAAIIYTHSHIDHVGGASAWADDGTRIWATQRFVDHFVKQYSVYRPMETARAMRQYGLHVDVDSLPCSALGRRTDLNGSMATGVLMPTNTFSDRTELSIGGVTFELVEAHGETHDQLFVYVRDRDVLMPGDNYYRAFPNIYTIRGTAPRPVDAWIESIDAMRRRAPAVLAPSHTVPIRGADNVRGALTRYRDAIQWVRDRVIEGANAGLDAEAIAEKIGLPAHLAEDPALAPLYGQIDWSARAIYDNNVGWFGGRAEELYPMPRRERARRTLALMGGADAVWREAEAAIDSGPAWALVLLSNLRDAGAASTEPGGRLAMMTARALERQAERIGNTNGRGYLLESAHELRHGRSEPLMPRPTDELLDTIPIASFFEMMATRLDPELSIDTFESVTFSFTDTSERFVVTVRRGLAEIVAGDPLPGTPAPIARVTTTTGTWRRLALGARSPASAVASGDLDVDGEVTGFYTFSKRFRRGL